MLSCVLSFPINPVFSFPVLHMYRTGVGDMYRQQGLLPLHVESGPWLILRFAMRLPWQARFVEAELMTGENRWRAGEHGLQEARKGMRFLEFPAVLQVLYARF